MSNVIVRRLLDLHRGNLCGHGWTQGKFGSVVAGGHPRDVFLIQRRPKPARYCRSGPFAFSLAKREGAVLDNDRAQVGETAGAAIIEVDKPKTPRGIAS